MACTLVPAPCVAPSSDGLKKPAPISSPPHQDRTKFYATALKANIQPTRAVPLWRVLRKPAADFIQPNASSIRLRLRWLVRSQNGASFGHRSPNGAPWCSATRGSALTAHVHHKILRVVGLVSADRDPMLDLQVVHHGAGCLAFGGAGGVAQLRLHHQPVAVLSSARDPGGTAWRPGPLPSCRAAHLEPRIEVRGRGMRRVAARLAPEVRLAVAPHTGASIDRPTNQRNIIL
jgi:hypothetical protein